jgi:cytochrome bd-type quinol oxidase subunit 2
VALNEPLFAVSTSLTVSIGLISFFIVYNTSKRIDDDIIKEFSQRLLILIGVMMLFLAYWAYYMATLTEVPFAQYPLFMALIFVFIYLMWNTLSFRKLSLTQEEKLDKMKKGESI